MTIELPATARGHLYPGFQFFDLFRGTDAYVGTRNGQAVTGKCGEATVNLTVDNVQVGPFGQFLVSGASHVSTLGRSFDVRTMADAVEAKCATGPKDTKALDPRELYSAVFYRVVDVIDAPVFEGGASFPGQAA